MADKQITVAVPEERVPEFYSWFAHFLAAAEAGPGSGRRGGPRGRGRGRGPGGPGGPFGPADDVELEGWSEDDGRAAAWLYRKLAPPAAQLFDVLIDAPGERISGNDLAAKLGLDKGAHGVAGILAWPGRYSRKARRAFPIATEGREDGGTDYFMEPDVAKVFEAARKAG
jgi:hypothetical protein